MPYPTSQPKCKHNLCCFEQPNIGLLQDQMGFSSTATIFQGLARELSINPTTIAAVYSYEDAPYPPPSRDLCVIGVADVSLSVVRKLVNEDDGIPECLSRCTLAVKRIDGQYGQKLPPKDIKNSTSFANFMRSLYKESSVAILAPDKYGRFSIVVPDSSMTSAEGAFESHDFCAACYVGKVDEVKEYLTQGLSQTVAPSSTQTDGDDGGGGLWQPPGMNADDEAAAPESNNGGLWQPPGADEDNGDQGFLWQPPGTADATPYDFGASTTSTNAWEPTEPQVGEKRKRQDEEFHADTGAAAADAFYSKLTRTLDTRADSRIFHMRAFNGWVKATQISELDPRTKGAGKKEMRVLDLACGKGGDLGKWVLHPRGVGNYVGIDVARGSLKDAAIRARAPNMRQKLKRCTFTCADLGADVPGRLKSPKHKQMQKLLSWSLQNESPEETGTPEFKMVRGGGISLDDRFDVVSIQFAIHYMMSTRQRARRFFRTVSELLEVGGNLIATTIDARVVLAHLMNLGLNLHFDDEDGSPMEAIVRVGKGACQIRFEPDIVKRIFKAKTPDELFGLEYTFTLVEGSDHEKGVGDAVNLPEWLTPIPVLKALAEEAGLVMEYAQNFHEFYAVRSDPLEYVAAHTALYNMKVLNRHGSIASDEWEISRLYMAVKFRKVSEPKVALDDSDDDGEEDEPPEIDPVVKAKLLPMAMMKAKKSVGDDEWKRMSSDEKTELTEIELRKLAK